MTQAQTQGNVMCKNTRSMPPWLKLKPRRRPPPSHQIRNWWRATGSILYSTIRVILSIGKLQFFYQFMVISMKFPSSKDFSAIHVLVFLLCALVLVKDQESDGKHHRYQHFDFVCYVRMFKCACVSHCTCVCVGRVNVASISVCACVCVARVNQP